MSIGFLMRKKALRKISAEPLPDNSNKINYLPRDSQKVPFTSLQFFSA